MRKLILSIAALCGLAACADTADAGGFRFSRFRQRSVIVSPFVSSYSVQAFVQPVYAVPVIQRQVIVEKVVAPVYIRQRVRLDIGCGY